MKLYMIEIDDGDESDPIIVQVQADTEKEAFERVTNMSENVRSVEIACTVDMNKIRGASEIAMREVTGGKVH